MSYAFENTPAHELPASEQVSIAIMQAHIRDGSLTMAEQLAKSSATPIEPGSPEVLRMSVRELAHVARKLSERLGEIDQDYPGSIRAAITSKIDFYAATAD